MLGIGVAMNPVDNASAVHTTVQATAERHFALVGTVTPEAAGTGEAARWDLNQPFEVIAISSITADADCNMNGINIRTDLIPEISFTEADPNASNLANDTHVFTAGIAATDSPLYGNVVLSVGTAEEGNCDAAETVVITAVVKTTGALTTAPVATIETIPGAGANNLAND